MNVYVNDLREAIIKPCLKTLGDYSCDVENLLVGTAMQESRCEKQLHSNIASDDSGLGIYRITREKHRDVWDKYLIQYPDLASVVRGFASQQQFFRDPHNELVTNLSYATVIAWMIYRAAHVDEMKPTELSNPAHLWALHFDNGTGCARNSEDFMKTYRKSVVDTDCHKMVA